jgi:hypothetical protein
MKITPCTTCKEAGWVYDENGDSIVCPTCLGVGAVNVQPAVPVLARFAGSLTGGTVVRGEISPANQAEIDSLAEDMDPMEAGW